MRLPSLLLAALVGLAAAGAASTKHSRDRFAGFHAEQVATSSPVKIIDSTYRNLTAAPRDFSVAVLLTALEPRLGCKICVEFRPEWAVLARSWIRGDRKGESGLVLATLDFAEGRETFSSLGLQTAPVLLLFPPTEGEHAVSSRDPIRYDFSNGAITAEHVRAWLSRHLPGRPHPEVSRPFNFIRWGSSALVVLGTITAIVQFWANIRPVVQSRRLWAGLGITSILAFTSGHMFNQIRGVPYVVGNGKGGIQYFAAGFQTQHGLESQIVAVIYGLLAFCIVTLGRRAPRIADPRLQSMVVYGACGVMLVTYSSLLSVFKVKNPGYPFSLPPFM